MNKFRLDLISKAFNKLDKTKDGQITLEDLKGKLHFLIKLKLNYSKIFILNSFLRSIHSKKSSKISKWRNERGTNFTQILRHF